MSGFGNFVPQHLSEGDLVYPMDPEIDSEDASSMCGEPRSESSYSHYSCPRSLRLDVPRSNPGATLSDISDDNTTASVETPSSSAMLNLQQYSLGISEGNVHYTTRGAHGFRCLFWFRECDEIFEGGLSGSREWYIHIMEHHISEWDQQTRPISLACNICGGGSEASWNSLLTHAFEHIRAGVRTPDDNLMEYLNQRRIITLDEKIAALARSSARASARLQPRFNDHVHYEDSRYYGTGRYRQEEMARTLRHMEPGTSP